MSRESERLKRALRDVHRAQEKLDTPLVRFTENTYNEVEMRVVEE